MNASAPKSIEGVPMTDSGSGGTVPLLQYIEARMRDADLRYSQRYDAQKEALGTALAASEKRLDGMNEFRKTLADQAVAFMPRAEADARFLALSEKVDGTTTRLDKSEGTGGGLKQGWGYLVGAIGLAATLVSVAVVVLRG